MQIRLLMAFSNLVKKLSVSLRVAVGRFWAVDS